MDPITRELIRTALESVVDEMALALVRTAYSPNLKSAMDLSSAICDPAGRLVAQGLTLPVHLGTIPDAMAAVLGRFGGQVRPGDSYILNDPYEGGTHLPDLVTVRPVFLSKEKHQGGSPRQEAAVQADDMAPKGIERPRNGAGRGAATEDELLGFVCTVAHHTDIGGRVAGGNACDSTEVYQEGLRVPPIRLHRGGELNDDFVRMLEANVRIPVKVLGDLRAQLAASHIGEEGLRALVGRFGGATVAEAFGELLDYSERLARAEIAGWPDGRYAFEDWLDGDGIDPEPIRIAVAVTVAGDQLTVDFAGSSAQVKGAINCVMSFTRSTTYACVRGLLPLDIPNNEGYFRAIRVEAPPGTIVNPRPPAAVAARGLTGFRIANAVFGALAQLAPSRIGACEVGGDTGITMGGYWADGRPFVFLEFLNCGWGGRPYADGVDGCASSVVNFSNYPAEVIENEYPLRIEEYGFIPDSGGPGQFRGALAIARQYRFLEESATLQLRTDRTKFPAYGLAGGSPGRLCTNALNGEGMPGKTLVTFRRGDVFRHELAGAGGWGEPLEREVGMVVRDVREGKVSVAHAREAYGVVVTERGEVDEAETRRLRGGAS
jgi:N-methylhydantoinase B